MNVEYNGEEKILTISVAAYNVEEFLANTLNSCVVREVFNEIEVLIVDDGSTDHTADIAQEYINNYPDMFQLIRKQNGGYGSTVNTSIQLARGKYIRLLDGDDWFLSENLPEFILRLKRTDADMVITPYIECWGDGEEFIRWPGKMEEDKVYYMKDTKIWPILAMHNLTVKTDIFRKHHIVLTEKCYYTDIEYYMYSFKYAETYIFFTINEQI